MRMGCGGMGSESVWRGGICLAPGQWATRCVGKNLAISHNLGSLCGRALGGRSPSSSTDTTARGASLSPMIYYGQVRRRWSSYCFIVRRPGTTVALSTHRLPVFPSAAPGDRCRLPRDSQDKFILLTKAQEQNPSSIRSRLRLEFIPDTYIMVGGKYN